MSRTCAVIIALGGFILTRYKPTPFSYFLGYSLLAFAALEVLMDWYLEFLEHQREHCDKHHCEDRCTLESNTDTVPTVAGNFTTRESK